MAYDIFGKKPINETGRYFYSNIWWWSPLWDYIYNNLEVLSEEDYNEGHYNSMHEINNEKAQKIAAGLKQKIESGEMEKYIESYTKYLDELPKKQCNICEGTGWRELSECNVCNNTGIRKSFETRYPMDLETMTVFADFCENSGGFEIG